MEFVWRKEVIQVGNSKCQGLDGELTWGGSERARTVAVVDVKQPGHSGAYSHA